MKKIALLYIISVLFCSCQTVKQIGFVLKLNRMDKKTEVTYFYGKKIPFLWDMDAIFIPCRINDTTHLLHYNSSIGGLLHENIPNSVKFPQCNKKIKLKPKTNENQRILFNVGLKYYDMESDFFYFKNFVGVVASQSTTTPISILEESQNRFLIGQDAFPNREVGMLLTFSDTTITLFNSYYEYDTIGFTLVKSLNTCRGLLIYLTVDSIEYPFLFNTGFKGFLSLPQNLNPVIDTLIVQQTNIITMGDLASITGKIIYKQKTAQPVMGMEFISHFDWIIDINKEKMYAKQIKNIE
jgi:hypothetical protein